MYPSVRDAFHAFTGRFEGADVPFMYLDSLGLVTTGNGNLIEPIAVAVGLPWRRPDGSMATPDETRAAWGAVKLRLDLARRGGLAFRNVTNLRLDASALAALLYARLDQNENILRGRFPEYDGWPADAQLGVLSMAWALGASWHNYPRFDAALLAEDWAAAAQECHIRTIPDTNGRNQANVLLFTNAAQSVVTGSALSQLSDTTDRGSG